MPSVEYQASPHDTREHAAFCCSIIIQKTSIVGPTYIFNSFLSLYLSKGGCQGSCDNLPVASTAYIPCVSNRERPISEFVSQVHQSLYKSQRACPAIAHTVENKSTMSSSAIRLFGPPSCGPCIFSRQYGPVRYLWPHSQSIAQNMDNR